MSVTVDDVTYDDGEVMVRFQPLGASSYHTVQLRQEQFDREFTIELLPVTGEIRFHEGLFEREFTVEVLPLTGEIRLHDGEFTRKPADEGDFR